MFNTLAHVHHFQHVLLLFQLELQVGGNGVSQAADFVDGRNGTGNFRRHFLGKFDVIFELPLQGARQGILFALVRKPFFQLAHIGNRTLVTKLCLGNMGTLTTFNQHLHGTVRQLEQLQNGRNRTDPVDVVYTRIVVGGITLGDQHDLLVSCHGSFKSRNGLFPADKQRDNHVRVHHYIT